MTIKYIFVLIFVLLTSNTFGLSCAGRPTDRIIGECTSGKCDQIIRINESRGSLCKILISLETLKGWEKDLLEFKLLNYSTDEKTHIYELITNGSLRDKTTTNIRADISASLRYKINIFPSKVRQLESKDMNEIIKTWKEKEYSQNKTVLFSKIKNWVTLIICIILVLFTIKKFLSILNKKQPLIGILSPVFNQILIFGLTIFITFNYPFNDSYTLIAFIPIIILIIWAFEFISVLMVWSLRSINKNAKPKT